MLLQRFINIVDYIFRSFKGLSPWLQENTKGTHTRYASSLLHSSFFLSRRMNCIPKNGIICPNPRDFLHDRLGRADPNVNKTELLNIIHSALYNNHFYSTGNHRHVYCRCLCCWNYCLEFNHLFDSNATMCS